MSCITTKKYHASHQTMDSSKFAGVERFNSISLSVFYNVHALSGFVSKLTIYLCILVTVFVLTSNNDAPFIIYDETCFFTHTIFHTPCLKKTKKFMPLFSHSIPQT